MKIVLCNAPPEGADDMARTLVQERLAACVNLVPVRSVYRWQGELQQDAEVTMLIKVSDERTSALRDRLRALHPYEVPEILVLDIDAGSSLKAYVDWVHDECTPAG